MLFNHTFPKIVIFVVSVSAALMHGHREALTAVIDLICFHTGDDHIFYLGVSFSSLFLHVCSNHPKGFCSTLFSKYHDVIFVNVLRVVSFGSVYLLNGI